MAVIGVQRMVSAPPEAVWEVLADGWVYTGWVVGASRMRAVDPAWPVPDARLHHSVGGWPLLLDDTTSVSITAIAIRRRQRHDRSHSCGDRWWKSVAC